LLKIFLVEDEYVVREGIKRINWQAHGYEFAGEAPDGELALPLIDKTRPDIVITDIKMPFMDGLELSRQLRRDYPETEIIILSGYAEFSYAREAVNLGVSRFLTKPISPAELIEQIDQIRDQIAEEGLTVMKTYKTGDVPVAHPLLSELPRHVESANKCLTTIGNMIGERGARVEKAARDLDAFRLH
jgi:YesN/AraC family two-component response regulator